MGRKKKIEIEERDYQYENDLEFLKHELRDQIEARQILKRMTNEFRHPDDHVYAIHINRDANPERNYFYRDIVKCDTLFASGHRLCFKSIRDMHDFLDFFYARLVEEQDLMDSHCDSSYTPDKKKNLKEQLDSLMSRHAEERLKVCELTDREVTTLTRFFNFRDKNE